MQAAIRVPPRTRVQDFKVLRTIGTGSTSAVVHARHLISNKHVAVKAISKKQLCSKKRVWYLRREIAIHKSLKDVEGVVRLEEVFEDGDGVYMVMELLSGNDVFWNLDGVEYVEEMVALEIVRQVLEVLVRCHAMGISHRDIKLENIVFVDRPDLRNGERLKVKLVDWGLACFRDENGVSAEKVGTLRYCAPEIVACEKYKPRECDMWSCGAVLYALLMKRAPYDGKSEEDIKRNVMKGKEVDWKERNISGDTKNLIRRLLSRHGRNRPSAKEALEMVIKIMYKLQRQQIECDRMATSCAQESRMASESDARQKDPTKEPFDLGMAINKFFGGLFGGNNNEKGSELCT